MYYLKIVIYYYFINIIAFLKFNIYICLSNNNIELDEFKKIIIQIALKIAIKI